MDTLITPAVFYLFVLIFMVCLFKQKGVQTIYTNFESLKYYVGTAAFFFVNINVLFFCSYCGHCHNMCIPFTMSAVLLGAVVYLSHLGKQTVDAFTEMVKGNQFDPMAPFFAIPYLYMLYEIFLSTFSTGLQSLHSYESKMLILLLYPLFVTLSEFNARVKAIKL